MPNYFLRYLYRINPIIFLILWIIKPISAQTTKLDQSTFRVMFYNLENLFDTYDDPVANDDAFTPDGEKSWTYYRYQKKLNDLAKVIIAVGEWTPPAAKGLCEVENFQVLLDLTTKTPLSTLGYQIVHENSDDERGIDVALLYRSEMVEKLAHKSLKVRSDSRWKTRDILYAQMIINQNDTLHFFVNHWPSRYGGKETTDYKRVSAAKTLRYYVDSLQQAVSNPRVLIMGDFNDEPNDHSLSEILSAKRPTTRVIKDHLYNMSYADFKAGKGTLVFKEINNTWLLFDQIIVSGSLIDQSGLMTKGMKSMIFNAPWLMRNDKPFRTYQGPIYLGGCSDHLPIFIDLYVNK